LKKQGLFCFVPRETARLISGTAAGSHG